MQLITAFDTAFGEFDRLVHEVRDDQWHAATPCADWSVRELVNHLVSEHLWAPHLLGGATLEDVGDRFDGDVLDGDPVLAWERAATASYPAFHREGALRGPVHVTGGEVPAPVYGWQMTADLAVHAWDLARGIEAEVIIPDELARTLHEQAEPEIPADGLPGLFGPPVEVPSSASPQDRLLALLGRRP
ncbi:TIGR03086 family metal-binding protein [Streptomyces oceani]|uniref:BEACH domain-containing protein n=1 Tax=Streptomyces oceani TaxID=1075402 RepID=A0A1E7KLV0_9ACTN|nr:TIGR03086 family metal-binding protein [Streptomyces oceani]OEV04949.1 hypothetical protein AN216_04860 [Streptomyces oceani]